MEVVKNKYHNGKIYTIRSYQTDKYYIGSTTQPLHKRLYEHRSDYKSFLNGNGSSISSFIIIENNDNYIELLEDYACDTKQQLHKREGELIRKHHKHCINKVIAGRTQKEWEIEHKEYIKNRQHTYYETHKESIKLMVKTYSQVHSNEIKLKKKAYAVENMEKLKLHRTEVMHCECGNTYTRHHKARHLQSKKHTDDMIK